jgi:hypothetical protein
MVVRRDWSAARQGYVIASAAWQSMNPEVMDCHAALAMTTGSFKAQIGSPSCRAAKADRRAALAMAGLVVFAITTAALAMTELLVHLRRRSRRMTLSA